MIGTKWRAEGLATFECPAAQPVRLPKIPETPWEGESGEGEGGASSINRLSAIQPLPKRPISLNSFSQISIVLVGIPHNMFLRHPNLFTLTNLFKYDGLMNIILYAEIMANWSILMAKTKLIKFSLFKSIYLYGISLE
jgi:hypothetical protein